ncbi:unnamed protein product [Rotaria sp. Silwood1]|nr:unnamed protein product [Rotaria sp. Silwood1]
MTRSLSLADIGSLDNDITTLCSIIAKKPDSAATLIDRMQQSMSARQEQMQQRYPHTYTYITKQENKDKLKAGGESCKSFFDGLKAPLSTDLQSNNESLQLIQQIMDHHIKDFMNHMQ